MKTSKFLILSLLSLLSFFPSHGRRIADMDDAINYCRENPISNKEGIWEFPDDQTKVLICKAEQNEYQYDIIVISTPDCRLNTGEKIGTLEATSDADKFKLSLYVNRKKGILTDLRSCMAKFNDSKGTFEISPRKLKFSIRSFSFLPKFWRMLRFSIESPTDKLSQGLIKIYPSYDGNGSSLRSPRYL